MYKKDIIALFKSKQTVFRTSDLSLYWQITNKNYLKTKIHRLIKNGLLIHLRYGLYALSQDYSPFELANKLVIPSYVSLHTVLVQAGAVFQYDSTIYSISQHSCQRRVQQCSFQYHKIKDEILFQKKGVQTENFFSIATPERALLDWLYLNPNGMVDNLGVFNYEACFELVELYNNKLLEKRLKHIYTIYQKENAQPHTT